MNGWTDLRVGLSDLIAVHLIYLNPKFHSHSYFIQFDIHLFLKSIENCKSQVMATLSLASLAALVMSHGGPLLIITWFLLPLSDTFHTF
jgi:hypothetical protein